MVSWRLVAMAASSVGWSALHRMVAPLSSLLTGRVSLETDIHVLEPGDGGRVSSWVWPLWSSCSPANHFSLAGGFPPDTIHSSSISSPAEAITSWPSSPTRWIRISVGASAPCKRKGKKKEEERSENSAVEYQFGFLFSCCYCVKVVSTVNWTPVINHDKIRRIKFRFAKYLPFYFVYPNCKRY